jgi:pimeloyl-ACP methyl ester carboxylesterase
MNRHSLVLCITAVTVLLLDTASALADVTGYPAGIEEIRYRSSGDGSTQPALFWAPESDRAVPLLVALHTWSSSYRSREPKYPQWCQELGWAYVYPNFRGPNNSPEALGSNLVVADIISAVDHVRSRTKIDGDRIYCVGVSGGGHASQLIAARAPEIWAGVSAWCGISDIAAWHCQCAGTRFSKYAQHIESALGGPPESSAKRLADAKHRSPITWLSGNDRLPPLDINHGIDDGRTGSVPFTHSLHAWNASVRQSNRIASDLVDRFYQARAVPPSLRESNQATDDRLYGANQPIFRCSEGNVRLTIFQGGHEINHNAALNWLAAQVKGKPANWQPKETYRLEITVEQRQSGK